MFFSMFSTKLSTIKVKENQRFMEFVIKVVKSGVFLFGICISVDTSCCSRHICLRLGIYIPVDTMRYCPCRARKCGVPEKACFLGCF